MRNANPGRQAVTRTRQPGARARAIGAALAAGIGLATLGGCASFGYDPADRKNPSELGEDEARQMLEASLARSYDVAKKNYKAPKVTYLPDALQIRLESNQPGWDTVDCRIELATDQKFVGFDKGNNPREANSVLKRFAVSVTEPGKKAEDATKPLCGLGWGDTRDAVAATDALSGLQAIALHRTREVEAPAAGGFDKVAQDYRAAKTKPELTEEARKHKVLAENAVEEKRYFDAIDQYDRALKIAPWWAEGRFKRGMLLGQQGVLGEAVSEMKRFLALAPESADARQAQDKIYIWEDRMGREQKRREQKAEILEKAKAAEQAKGDTATSSQAAPSTASSPKRN